MGVFCDRKFAIVISRKICLTWKYLDFRTVVFYRLLVKCNKYVFVNTVVRLDPLWSIIGAFKLRRKRRATKYEKEAIFLRKNELFCAVAKKLTMIKRYYVASEIRYLELVKNIRGKKLHLRSLIRIQLYLKFCILISRKIEQFLIHYMNLRKLISHKF